MPNFAEQVPEPIPDGLTRKQRMQYRLKTERGRAEYRKRMMIAEPVFGQIKHGRGFRAFLLRGHEKVSSEWTLVCAVHNLLKLFGSGWAVQPKPTAA
jgi:hypothetical protein